MSKLHDIQSQIEKLQQEAAAIRQQELTGAIAKVRELCAEYGLTAQMIGLTGKKGGARLGKAAAPAAAGEPKYREPKSGKTWTGKGKPPVWIASARNRDKFLIDKPESATAEPVKSAAPVKAAKAPVKAAKVATSVKRVAAKPAAKTESKSAAKSVVKKADVKKATAAKPVAAKVAAPKAAARKTAPKKSAPGKASVSAVEVSQQEGVAAQQTEV